MSSYLTINLTGSLPRRRSLNRRRYYYRRYCFRPYSLCRQVQERVTLISSNVRWNIFPGVKTIRLERILLALDGICGIGALRFNGRAEQSEFTHLYGFAVVNILCHHVYQTAHH